MLTLAKQDLTLKCTLDSGPRPLLIKSGADPNIQTKQKQTALMAASFYGDLETVRILIEGNTNVDLQDEITALMFLLIFILTK